jgi:hypothetical protein
LGNRARFAGPAKRQEVAGRSSGTRPTAVESF